MNFSLFPSFFDTPANLHFIDQEADEKIEIFLRQHWIVNVGWVLTALILIMLPAWILELDILFRLNFFASIPLTVLIGGIILWYLLVIAYILEQFLYWYFNIYIVTNLHIVQIKFSSLLSRSVTETKLKDLESVRASIKGVFGPLFNFGNVDMETAAKDQEIHFVNVPKPDFVSDRVEDLRRPFDEGGSE